MTLLKNGLIYNGKNEPPFKGSVMIDHDRIVQVFEESIEYAIEDVIDCEGKIIAPGFIDAHSHNDFYTTVPDPVPYFLPFVEQGITSMVTGNCGFSPAGYQKDTAYRSLIGGGLFHAVPLDADYSSFKNWIETSNRTTPVNIFPLVGHGTARIGVNGQKGGSLSTEQFNAMMESIENALKEGAYGVSLGLMYEPSMYAPKEELLEIAKLVKRYDRILTVHNRAMSKISTSYPPFGGKAHNLRAIEEMIELVKATGVRLQNSHLIFVGKNSFPTFEETITMINRCNAEGGDIGFDIFSLTYGSSIITVVLPGWYLLKSLKQRKTLWTKLRLWLEIHIAKSALGLAFSDILIADGAGKIDEYQGMTIDQIARKLKKSDYQAYLWAVDASDGKAGVYIHQYSNKPIIEKILKHDKSILMTDAWVQESGIQNGAAYFGMINFLMMEKENEISLEHILHKMTLQPALRFQIKNRGMIEKGCYADLVVFDKSLLGFDEKTIEKPKGIQYVFINGKKVVDDGKADLEALRSSGRVQMYSED